MNNAAATFYYFILMLLLWGKGLFGLLYVIVTILLRVSRRLKDGVDGYGEDSWNDQIEQGRGFEVIHE